MKEFIKVISFLFLVVGCKQPFSETSETALAVPTVNKIETVLEPNSVVFIAGFDEGDNTYYSNAKSYFEAKNIDVVSNLFSINEIIIWLNQHSNKNTFYDKIHIVSHSNPWLGMSLKTHEKGERISVKTLQEAIQKNEIPRLKYGIASQTKVIFHSCGLGENQKLLQALQYTFTTAERPKVYASKLFNVFGGKFAGHYLAKPYYGFYPTAESPGPLQLTKEFKIAYPETTINWFKALKTRKETTANSPYTYKFNIPVNWEFTFDKPNDIPALNNKDAIMDWVSESPEMTAVLLVLNIPIEKYRWKCRIDGNTLIIKGKTTVLCVLAPVLEAKDPNEYKIPRLADGALYQIL